MRVNVIFVGIQLVARLKQPKDGTGTKIRAGTYIIEAVIFEGPHQATGITVKISHDALHNENARP